MAIQARLRKTVVFVTHDIDEAVKLGDRIAIMREGRLVQYDTPERILAYPADDFVAGFVGAERALKRLSLAPVSEALDPGRRRHRARRYGADGRLAAHGARAHHRVRRPGGRRDG